MRVIPSWQHWASPARIRSATHLSVEGPVQVDDVGGTVLVVPTWDGFRLTRASRFYYRGTAQDFNAPASSEADTLAQFLVRVPFRGLGRSPYLTHRDYESVAAAPEVDTLGQFLVRVPFKGLGQSRYLRHTAQDLSVVEPFDLPYAIRAIPFKALGRNPYLFRTAQDESFVAAPEADTLAQFLVRLQFHPLVWVKSARGYVLTFPQDEDAPPPPVSSDTSPYFPTFRPRRGR